MPWFGWLALAFYLLGLIASLRPIARGLHMRADDDLIEFGAVGFFALFWPVFAPLALLGLLAKFAMGAVGRERNS